MILYILYNMIVGLAAGVGLLLIARTGTYRRRLAIRRTPPTQTACSEDPSVIRAKGPTDERSFCLQSPFHSKGGPKNPTIAQSR